jgi:hypothetical protein
LTWGLTGANLRRAAREGQSGIAARSGRARADFFDLAWGQAQMADYVAHHYHQPSDEYRADWDFRGNAKLARFGFVLGWLASEQANPIEWKPGDEFEAARKASEKAENRK